MLCIFTIPDQVGICREIELLLGVIEDGCHGTLAKAFSALILRAIDLLLHPFRVIVLNLLKPLEQMKEQLDYMLRLISLKKTRNTYVWPLRFTVRAACPVSLSKGSGRYGLSNSMFAFSLAYG